LVRLEAGQRLSGRIVETEAYCDSIEPDLACHASRGGGKASPRTAVMFGPPGFAYVYFSYGMHWLFNLITGSNGQANAVLVRALAPESGLERMAARRLGKQGRARPQVDWCSGPARLCQSLAIDGRHDGLDLCSAGSPIWLEAARPVPQAALGRGPRVGLGRTPEPWRSLAWRYGIAGDPNLSRPLPQAWPGLGAPEQAG
jgi:DNA-3-methyladenine glycosylase